MSGRAFPLIHTWFQKTVPYLMLATLMWHSTTIIASTSDRPNIILFLVDDMGWQDTSVPFWDRATPFNKHFRTPNMERLAKQGRRFTQAYACAVCSPTRTSIMTGQNAARHRVTNWTLYEDRETSGTTPRLLPPQNWKKSGLQPSTSPTLPQVLRDNLGYRTIHAGKAHWGAYDTQGSDPLTLGFDVNIAGHAAGGPGHYHGEQNYGNKEPGGRTRPWGIPGLEAYHGSDQHLTEVLTLEAQKAVTESVQQGKPFYLYMAHYAVHAPIQAHEKHLSNYSGKNYPGTQIPIAEPEANYASMVEGMDASLGALLKHVEELGVAENTIVMFASDNGTLSLHARGNSPRGTGRNTHSWPLREGKGSAYEGGTRIPLIVSWAKPDPGNAFQRSIPIPRNSISDTQVIVEDFFPTIIRWASGRKYRSETSVLDGIDFTPAVLGEPKPEDLLHDRPLIFHYPHQWTGRPNGGYQPHSTIRHDDWKAIYFYENRSWELYHLAQDISESLDLSQSQPEKLDQLATELKEILIKRGADWPQNKATGIDEAMVLPNELIVPGQTWEERSALSTGLNETLIANIPSYLKGRGMIVKDGYRVFSWGDVSKPGDVASAAKPFYTHFLTHAVETGRLDSFDQKVTDIRPELDSINAKLDHKDRQMTFAHLANQTACYGVSEAPGSTFDYNDWQMALFWDSLFEGVYSVPKENVDDEVFHPMLTDLLRFEDPVSMLAFGVKDRAGRLKISPRDFCRFGWLYLMNGRWGNQRIIRPEHVHMLTQSPLPNSLPRTKGIEADMLPNQRTIGSRRIPDNQTDHYGSYSWLWWINGKRESGKRFWPDAPEGIFACLGHQHGMRGMVVIPEWRMVMSWNDTDLNKKPWPNPQTDPHPLNPVFQWIGEALKR